jgi:hypothetical protein
MKRRIKMETNERLDNQIFNIIEEIEDIIDATDIRAETGHIGTEILQPTQN